jgi:hypothetical protein
MEVFSTMADFATALGATKGASTLLVLFIRAFLHRMGREAKQGAIGLVIDRDYLEIGFPLDEPSTPKRPKPKKRR